MLALKAVLARGGEAGTLVFDELDSGVGGATAEAARKAGYINCFSAEGDARALADLARRSGIAGFLHARGRDAAGDLKAWLAESGQQVTEAVLYEAQETGPAPASVAAAAR